MSHARLLKDIFLTQPKPRTFHAGELFEVVDIIEDPKNPRRVLYAVLSNGLQIERALFEWA